MADVELEDLLADGTVASETLVDTKVTDHEAAGNPHPTYETSAEAQAKVDTHSADTTSVHGIADTSLLDTIALRDAAIAAISAYKTRILADDAVGYWHCSEASGNLTDDAGSLDAVPSGTVVYEVDGPLVAEISRAVRLNGTDAYFVIPDGAALDRGDGAQTWEWWSRRTSAADAGIQMVLSKASQFNAYYEAHKMTIDNDGSAIVAEAGTTPDTLWHHWMLRRGVAGGTGNVHLLKDGLDVTTEVNPANALSSNNEALKVGRYYGVAPDFYAQIEVMGIAVYDRKLDEAEGVAHYELGIGGGLAAHRTDADAHADLVKAPVELNTTGADDADLSRTATAQGSGNAFARGEAVAEGAGGATATVSATAVDGAADAIVEAVTDTGPANAVLQASDGTDQAFVGVSADGAGATAVAIQGDVITANGVAVATTDHVHEGGGSHGEAYASPPTASDGDLWTPSDGYHDFLRRESGVWVPYISGVQGAIPPTSGWSWVNQGTATVDEAGAAHVMVVPNNEVPNKFRARTAPATPYTITVAMRLLANPGQAGTIGYPAARLYHRESSSGKIYEIGLMLDQGAGMATAIAVSYWTAPTTFDSRPTGGLQLALTGTGSIIWLRIADDGTNRKYSWSLDGRNFYNLISIARTTNMTADQVGWGGGSHSSSDSAGGTIITLLSWKVT